MEEDSGYDRVTASQKRVPKKPQQAPPVNNYDKVWNDQNGDVTEGDKKDGDATTENPSYVNLKRDGKGRFILFQSGIFYCLAF